MDNINWKEVYLQLYAYTDQLLKTKLWFRKDQSDSYLKGKQAHDYVSEAIEKFILEPEKYDRSTGRSLVNYLKFHLIRSLVSNDAKSQENISSSDILSLEQNNDDDDTFNNVDALLPFTIPYFDHEIDFKEVLNYLQNELKKDPIALTIFEEVRCNGLKRRDVLQLHNMQEEEFDNGMKRLRTALKHTANKYQIKNNYE